ncbi:MAG: tRNA pseudouridine(55) synthase TruB [Desulfovermiculus sp.]|nr:tRNA pseudouridine(55) synthase TruB [Desulfovermiculus sp.]
MPQTPSQQHGALILDKPQGPTSSACVQKIKRQVGQSKIGHAGTLDPMATGVLVILLGQGTKLAPYLSEGRKTYQGTLELGKETDTYDIQGTLTGTSPWEHLSPELVAQEVLGWQQLHEQIVPPYSAAKHKGKAMYALARAGKEVPIKTKPVSIDQVKVLHVDLPGVGFRLQCSAGTYVRSLAHSLGMRLGCGAVLTSLIREECEPFTLDQAYTLDQVLTHPERLPERIIALEDCLPQWSRLHLSPVQAEKIRNGTWVTANQVSEWKPSRPGQQALLLDPTGQALALAEARMHASGLHWAVLRGLWGNR